MNADNLGLGRQISGNDSLADYDLSVAEARIALLQLFTIHVGRLGTYQVWPVIYCHVHAFTLMYRDPRLHFISAYIR